MKIIYSILFTFTFAGAAFAQQPAQYSMYMWNKYAFNPAYAGLDNSLSITGVYRNQWVGLAGAPETQTLNAHMPLYIAGGGAGLGVESERIGSWRQTVTAASYDYQMELGTAGVLSLGLSAGLLQRELDGSKVRTPDGIYDSEGNLIDHQDILLTDAVQSGTSPTFHAGAFYQGEKLEIGISAMNLLENEVVLSNFSFQPDRTYFLYLGYQMDLSKRIRALPSVLVKSSTEQTQIDLSVLLRYDENIFLGASFRGYSAETKDAVSLIGGFKLNQRITLSYSYDIATSGLKTVNDGTHEILLNYNLGKAIGKGRPPEIIYNPRSM